MDLYFSVDNLHIELTEDEYVVNDSSNYVKARFSLSGDVWTKNTIKTALFHYNGNVYAVILEDNSCYIPTEVLKGEFFAVGLATAYIENDTNRYVYTDLCEVETRKSCFHDDLGTGEPTLTYAQQLIALYSQIQDDLENNYVTNTRFNELTGGVDIPALEEQVYENLDELGNSRDKVFALQQFKTQAERKLSTLSDDVDSINTDIGEIRTSLNNYVTNSKLSEITGGVDISLLKRQVDANLNGIIALMERVDVLESWKDSQ